MPGWLIRLRIRLLIQWSLFLSLTGDNFFAPVKFFVANIPICNFVLNNKDSINYSY